MSPLFTKIILGDTIVPCSWLLGAAFVFSLTAVSILLFVFFFLWQKKKQQKTKTNLRALYSDLIAACILSESTEETTDTLQEFVATNGKLFTKPFARNVLIREIVKTTDSISGTAADNLRFLFAKLELDKDTFARFQSKKWHRKASAIQRLAEMKQAKYLLKIYRETNNENSFIRTEAQIAVVKLTGFKGLRFLNIVNRPVSQWQQLSLINHLKEGEIEEDKIKVWLRLKNDSVVEFALRLVEIYKCFGLHDEVVACLQHSSLTVRWQALQALKEIPGDGTAKALVQHFSKASRQEQLLLLDLLSEVVGGVTEVRFLTALLHHHDKAFCSRAMRAIQQISPAWSAVIVRQIKDHPSYTHMLSSLEKKAV